MSGPGSSSGRGAGARTAPGPGAGSGSGGEGRQRLYLHVGLPKSGTTFLQAALADHRTELRAAGFVYPFVRPEAMFHAAAELRSQEALWGLDASAVAGTWRALLDRVREVGATGIVSHEILAGAAAPVVERVARDCDDVELHVVVTARDLARQAVAHWQEEVKNGRSWSFAEFEGALWSQEESAGTELGFWRSQDLADVISRWGRAVPPERLHVVVVPPPGAPRHLLWERFAAAVGLDPSVLDPAVVRTANDSLGVAEVALLREVQRAVGDRLQQPVRAHLVKRLLAQRLLAARSGERPLAPAALVERLAPIARSWVELLAAEGCPVEGDAAALEPVASLEARHPDDVEERDVVAGLPDLVADLLVETRRRRESRPAGVGDGHG